MSPWLCCAMGEYFQKIGDPGVSAGEAAALAASIRDWLVGDEVISADLSDCALGGLAHAPGTNWGAAVDARDRLDDNWTALWTNGLRIGIGPTVFWDLEPDDLVCPHCGAVVPFDRFDGLDEWAAHGRDVCSCVGCGQMSGLNAWLSSIGWGVGHLCLEFWNWPPLSEDFRSRLAERLRGRPVFLEGKL